MTLQEFIFDNSSPHKVTRHLVFWLTLSVAFYAGSLVPVEHMFFASVVNLFCYLPAIVIFSYVLLRFLPPLLRKARYGRCLLAIALASIVPLALNIPATFVYFYLTYPGELASVRLTQIAGQAFINSGHAFSVGGLLLGFRLVKQWMARQIENQKLTTQKVVNEIELEKARLYPAFLLQSLNSLYKSLCARSTNSPEMILKLSEVLSYILYESSTPWIRIEKELEVTQCFLSIEQINQAGHVHVEFEPLPIHERTYTKPLILFWFLQSCFETLGNRHDTYHCHVQMNANNNIFRTALTVHQLSGTYNKIDWSGLLNRMPPGTPERNFALSPVRIEQLTNGSVIHLSLPLLNEITE